MANPAALVDELVQVADDLTDDDRRRLRSALARGRGGRPAIDDSDALAEMARLLENGIATSVWGAASLVAATLGRQQSHEATVQRLFKKFAVANSGNQLNKFVNDVSEFRVGND